MYFLRDEPKNANTTGYHMPFGDPCQSYDTFLFVTKSLLELNGFSGCNCCHRENISRVHFNPIALSEDQLYFLRRKKKVNSLSLFFVLTDNKISIRFNYRRTESTN